MLPRLMMLPLPRAAIFGPSAATRKYADRTLAAKSRSKVAASRSAAGPNQAKPALLTSTSTGPACSTRWSTWTGSVRSAATKRALPPAAVIVSTTAEPRSASRPCTTISAPCRPSSSAAALPIPEVAPVTRALMPSRSRWSFMLVLQIDGLVVPWAVVVSYDHPAEQDPSRGIRNVTASLWGYIGGSGWCCRRQRLRVAAGRQGAGGGLLGGQERAELGDGAHQRGGEDHGGVLVHADLDQALQVAQLQRQRMGHHGVGGLPQRGGGQRLALGVDDLGALLPLGLGLAGHGAFHAVGQLDVLQLHQRHLYAPLCCGDLEALADVQVDLVGFRQRLI